MRLRSSPLSESFGQLVYPHVKLAPGNHSPALTPMVYRHQSAAASLQSRVSVVSSTSHWPVVRNSRAAALQHSISISINRGAHNEWTRQRKQFCFVFFPKSPVNKGRRCVENCTTANKLVLGYLGQRGAWNYFVSSQHLRKENILSDKLRPVVNVRKTCEMDHREIFQQTHFLLSPLTVILTAPLNTSAHLQLQLSAASAQQWLTCSLCYNYLCSCNKQM